MGINNAISALEAFDAYYPLQDKLTGGKFNELGVEARKRLVQARMLLDRVIDLQHEGNKIQLGPPQSPSSVAMEDWVKGDECKKWLRASEMGEFREQIDRKCQISNKLELQTECFYWIAGRARTVIRLMPGLSAFEAIGVRDVRNKLIEHSEKGDSGVTIASFAWGNPQAGPVLKAARWNHQQDIFPDDGLFVNADAFFERVRLMSLAAVSNPKLILSSKSAD